MLEEEHLRQGHSRRMRCDDLVRCGAYMASNCKNQSGLKSGGICPAGHILCLHFSGGFVVGSHTHVEVDSIKKVISYKIPSHDTNQTTQGGPIAIQFTVNI